RRRVDSGEDFAAGGLHIGVETLVPPLCRAVRLVCLGKHGRRAVSCLLRLESRALTRLDETLRRLPPRSEIADFTIEVLRARGGRFSLLLVEFELLLTAVDVELASVRILADRGRAAVGVRLLHPKPAERRFRGGQSGCGARFALSRIGKPRAGGLDPRRQPALAAAA